MHISTNDLHCCKPARLMQLAPSGGRPCPPPATAPPRRSKNTKMLPAMLMPRNTEFYALYRDVNDCIFVRTSCHHSIFMLQQHWRQLANVLPEDSICRVIAYRNKAGDLMLGVYDLLRLCGVCVYYCNYMVSIRIFLHPLSTFEKNGNIVSMTNRVFMDLAP